MTRAIQFRYFGLSEAQQAMYSAAIAVSPSGGLGRMVQNVTLQAFRYMSSIVHVDTGALRGGLRMESVIPARWHIYLANVNNPKSGQPVSSYAEIENARGGDHGFIDDTVNQADVFIGRARSYMLSQLP